MSKLLWRIHTKQEDVWVAWVTSKLKGRNIWQISIPNDCAWSWRKLFQLRDGFRKLMQVKIGDGRECSLFYDHWFGEARLHDLIDTTPWQNYKQVNEWMNGNSWNIPSSFLRRYPRLSQAIISVSITGGRDTFVWTGSDSGFSIKSAYDVIRRKSPKVSWRNIVWDPGILPKQAFILWFLFQGRLKTRDLLRSRGMQISAECGLCNQDEESIEHLFFSCPVSKLCWESLLAVRGMRRSACSWTVEKRWILRNARSRNRRSKKIIICLAAAVYAIWAERNGRVFRNEQNSQAVLLSKIESTIQLLEGF